MSTDRIRLVRHLALALPLLAFAASPARARTDEAVSPEPTWVFFCDKGTTDLSAALSELEHTYDPRAIERRKLRRTSPGLFDARDVPVHAGYVEAVVGTGARLRVTSSWLNAISVEATPAQRTRIEQLSFVERLEAVGRHAPRAGGFESVSPERSLAVPESGGFYGAAEAQLDQIRLVELHAAGFTGDGVIIGVLDTGFLLTHVAYNEPGHSLQVTAEFDFVNNDGNTANEAGDLANQHDHGTYILGTMGAYDPGSLVGGAYDASFVLAKVEDLSAEYSLEEDFFVAGLQFIEANGGDVATSSVVIFNMYTQDQLDGRTSVMAQGFNTATDNGVHCFQGAGNEGHDSNPNIGHLVPPADAIQTITVGAVDSDGDIASFSSDGPSADGRIKPEVLARGVSTATTGTSSPTSLVGVSGTSLATPLAAAVAACLVEAHPTWTVSEMRGALFQTADYFTANGTHDPLFVEGFGILDALAASTGTCGGASVTSRNAGTNPASYSASPPLLGGTFSGEVDLGGTTGHNLATVVGFESPISFALGGGQTLLVNVADPAGELLGLGLAPGPAMSFTLAVPHEPTLCGYELSTQALHLGGVVPFALSNAQDLSVGY